MKITASRKDQLGMQVYCRIYTMAYAELNGFEYIHTPFPDRYSHLEDFFNLGFSHKLIKNDYKNVKDIGPQVIPVSLCKKRNPLEPIKFNKSFLAKLRYKYYLTEKNNSKQFAESKGLKVSIHVRKCDKERKLKGRDPSHKMWDIRQSPENYIPACFRKLTKIDARKISVHAHSNENLDLDWNYDLFQDPKFEIFTHFGTALDLCIHDLISSDILFRYGISSFSGICSIYNRKLSVFVMPPYRAHLANPYISDNCCYMNEPLSFEPLPTFDEVALDNFLCNHL